MFKDELKRILPNGVFNAVWESFFIDKMVGFFINIKLTNSQEIKNELENLGINAREFFPNFFICNGEQKEILTHSKLFSDAKVYIQNPSSFLDAIFLKPKSGQKVLDMCASPGGKTIVLANLMQNGYLAAMEANRNRFFILRSNLQKYNCGWVKIFNKDARSIAYNCKEMFDKILLDAPCSGYSMFNENFKEKSYKEIKALAKLQKQLLNSALEALKVDGEVVYSTCTFFQEENEEVIKNALNSKFNVTVENMSDFIHDEVGMIHSDLGTRIIPDNVMDAFFMAKLKKLSA